jgi:hypothetical protein
MVFEHMVHSLLVIEVDLLSSGDELSMSLPVLVGRYSWSFALFSLGIVIFSRIPA